MDMNYASSSVGTAGLTTGVIGTALGVLNGAGGLLSLGGIGGKDYVSKEAYEVQLKLIEAERSNAVLAADLASEKKMVEVFNAATTRINDVRDELNVRIRELEKKVDCNAAAQGVMNAQFGSQLTLHGSQIEQLFSLTKLVVPNASVSPGWTS